MEPRTPFQLLLKLFQDRFFESDDSSPGASFDTNIYQVMGFLLTTGFIVAYFMLPGISVALHRTAMANIPWAIRGFQLFAPAYTFAVIGFASFFEWDMLFPNRRDFLILATFPIGLRDLFLAQFAALAKFLGLLIFSTTLFPTLVVLLMSLDASSHEAAARLMVAHIGCSVGVAAFAFFAVAGLQGVLINLTTPRFFRRISPYIQMCGMSLMTLSLLLFPIYTKLLRHAAETRQLWLWLFPPIWFSGFQDLCSPNPHGLFADFGIHAVQLLAGAILLCAVTWTLGFRRHYRRTLESEDARPRVRESHRSAPLARSPEERAIFRFSGKILARSRKHQLFLVTYLSVGISLAVNFGIMVRDGRIAISDDGARAVPFLITFFVISGFRAVFQFPAELTSNWLFRITESRWAETSRSVTRKFVLLRGLVPALALMLPLEIALWGGWRVPLHITLQFACGALLIELMFWTFDKVPFTCSYFPGRTSLSILFVLYLYGFTHYSFDLADLELAIEGRALYGLLFFAGAAALLVVSWRRHPAATAVRFDASEPTIQTLDLT